jgi:excinuclease ABC subunit B
MYADRITGSMQRAMDEVKRRRQIQLTYNKEQGITPQSIKKAIRDITERVKVAEAKAVYTAEKPATREDVIRLIKELETQMKQAAKNLEFEKAALLRDRIFDLRKEFEPVEIQKSKILSPLEGENKSEG